MGTAHDNYFSLLLQHVTGELPSEQTESLESHIGQCGRCFSTEQELTNAWRQLESLQVADIPAELYKETRQTILARLKRERSPLPWLKAFPRADLWSVFLSIFAGLAMTGFSYLLIHNYGNLAVHPHNVLIPLFGMWWVLFASGFWFLVQGAHRQFLHLDWVAAWSILITGLTLAITFLAFEIDVFRRLVAAATHAVTLASQFLLGVGNAFATNWGIHGCLASFIGGSIIGFGNNRSLPNSVMVAAVAVTILLLPAIYLQSSSHNHGVGMIAWAAFGVFIGSLAGMGLGFFFRRQVAYRLI